MAFMPSGMTAGGCMMIDSAWCRMMAAYNSEMNRRLYAAANELTDEQRRADLGAFFGSVHGTLNHILWADHQWMSRFDGWEKPDRGIRQSTEFFEAWADLQAARVQADARIEEWAPRAHVIGDLTWFSGASQREMTKPRAMLVTHMFNHQTHHRGQVHALLTRLGVRPADTDLPWIA